MKDLFSLHWAPNHEYLSLAYLDALKVKNRIPIVLQSVRSDLMYVCVLYSIEINVAIKLWAGKFNKNSCLFLNVPVGIFWWDHSLQCISGSLAIMECIGKYRSRVALKAYLPGLCIYGTFITIFTKKSIESTLQVQYCYYCSLFTWLE